MAHMADYDVVEEEIIADIGDYEEEVTSGIDDDAVSAAVSHLGWSTIGSKMIAESSISSKSIVIASTSTNNNNPPSGTKRRTRKAATIEQCQYCGVILKHPSKIAAHLRTHTGERPFECGICRMRFTQLTPMRMHVRRHVGDTQFECSWNCGKRFVSKALCNAHELHQHMGEKRHGPPRPHLKPPKRAVTLVEMDDGVDDDDDDDDDRSPIVHWQPPIGDIAPPINAIASKRLDEVIEAVASGVDLPETPNTMRRRPAIVAQCQECGIILKHPSKITAHMRTHSGERPFECGVCGMKFAMANPLRIHLRRAHTGEKPYDCTWECGKRFVSNAARNEHERIVHEGVKRYQCTVGSCRRLFTRRRYLLMHQQRAHDPDTNAIAINTVLESVEIDPRRVNGLSSFVPVDHNNRVHQLVYASSSGDHQHHIDVEDDDVMPPQLIQQQAQPSHYHNRRHQQIHRFTHQIVPSKHDDETVIDDDGELINHVQVEMNAIGEYVLKRNTHTIGATAKYYLTREEEIDGNEEDY